MISAVRATSRWPLFVQLACAVLGTLVCFIIQLPIEARSFGDPFAVFLACAFIVALLFAYGLWFHFPSIYPLFTPQQPDKVASHVLLVSLGPEAHGRIMAAASARSPEDACQ